MAKIFINYRREDSVDFTGRIYDRLERAFGREALFRDMNTIPYGESFTTTIRANIQESSIMLVIIGPVWLNVSDAKGLRRLDSALDYVRMEIEMALERGLALIPILINDVTMPSPDKLPPSIRELATRQAFQVQSDPDFDLDMAHLIATIGRMLNPTPPTGVVLAEGTVRKKEEKRSTYIAGNGPSVHYDCYLTVSIFNPLTNQPEEITLNDCKRYGKYEVGDRVQLRYNTKTWSWFRGWKIND